MRSLFPFFGAKSRAADQVWEHLGDPECYIEPFAGSLAVLLARPTSSRVEIACDLDGLLINFWRSIQHWPEVLPHLTGTVSEIEIHAKHSVLLNVKSSLNEKLRADEEYYDPLLAAYWWEGISSWLGQGFGARLSRQRPHIDRSLKGAWANGMTDDRVVEVARRIGNVVLLAGDWANAWERAASMSILKRFNRSGGTGVFLDPPYAGGKRAKGLYVEDAHLNERITEWCFSLPPHVRVVIAGYADEYPELAAVGWRRVPWRAPNGYAQGDQRRRDAEVLYLSPVRRKLVRLGATPLSG